MHYLTSELFASISRNKYSLFLWMILLGFISVIILLGNERTVTPSYQQAALDWMNGENLYAYAQATGHGYLYLPQAAILYTPFAVLPFTLSELLWRFISIGVLIYALWKMSTLYVHQDQSRLFLIATLIAIPLGFSCFRNGQMNLMLTSLGLLSVLSIIKGQWNWATFWLILGLALKPLMIVLFLLAGTLFKPLRFRLLGGLLIMGLLPFLTQNANYVVEQYMECFKMLSVAKQLGVEELNLWPQLFGFFYTAFDWAISENIQFVIRIIVAVITLCLAYISLKKKDIVMASMIILALSVCYVALFNPRMEGNGYIILAPSLAFFAYVSLYIIRQKTLFFTILLITLGFIFARTIWQQVLPAIVFTLLIITWIFSNTITREKRNYD